MRLARLPDALSSVGVPEYFSPSGFFDLRHCPLKTLVRADSVPGALPPSAVSLFGRLLHHVREQLLHGRWGTARSGRGACTHLLASAARDLDAMLQGRPETASLAPLKTTIGRAAWSRGAFELSRWAERLDVEPNAEAPEAFSCLESWEPRV